MKRILAFVVINLFVSGIVGHSFAEEKIVIAGSGDTEALLRILAQAFESGHY